MLAFASPEYPAYRATLRREQMPQALRLAALTAIAVVLGFVPVDYVFFREMWLAFLPVRAATAALILGAERLLRRRNPELGMIVVSLAAGAMVLAVTAGTGGPNSLYTPGLILLFAGIPVLTTLTMRQTLLVCATLTGVFAAYPLLFDAPVDFERYGTSLVFLASGVFVASASAAAIELARFSDYLRRREVEAARDRLATLDEAKTRFTANVHHELRTPLTLMLAPLEGLRSGDYGPLDEPVRRTLRTMLVNGRRLLKLINNLLDLAKLESDQFTIERAPLDASALVEEVVEGARPMAERKQITLRAEVPATAPPLYADADALEKVLVNLVGNALKFTEADGEIVVRLLALEDGVELQVADSGVGLEPDQLERIFDRFAQVDGSATREHEGTGIGLSLTRELVDLHGGTIRAESAGLGHGTTVRVWLPRGEPDAGAAEAVVCNADGSTATLEGSIASIEAELGLDAPADARSGAAPHGPPDADAAGGATAESVPALLEAERSVERWEQRRGERAPMVAGRSGRPPVLVADDNGDMRELLAFVLGREFDVRVVRNGREALEALEHFEPDLVVTDIMMPEMSGTELCREIKSRPDLRDMPVMLVSSKAESEMKIEGLELGADDYVTKPFHPRELLARARSLVGLRRAQRELAARNEELETALAELRLAQTQLVQSERLAAVGELAAGVAHEVNNPVNFALNAVRALDATVRELEEIAAGAAALDWADPVKLAEQGEALRQTIEQSGGSELAETLRELGQIVTEGLERTHQLVGDLRDFAAPGRGGPHGAVDLLAGLRSTAQLVAHQLEKRAIALRLEAPGFVPQVEGDPGALNQVFLNLIKNAAEAMETMDCAGTITVSVTQAGERVRIRVADEGPGMTAEVQARLFEPFFTTKPAGRGTGLGLAMCRRIIDAHGGSIEVASEPGAGTVFSIELPLPADADADAASHDGDGEGGDAS